MDLPLNRSRSSQLSCLGSGIPSLVGGFGSKVIKFDAGSSLSQFRFKGRVIEGTQTLDLFSMATGLFRIKSVLGRPGKDGLDREAMPMPPIGFPSFAVSGEGDKGEAPNMFYPQPPSVISNLNPLFLFTSTLRATTSSPLYSKGKR